MALYITCPDCGSNLDPGERCDCHDVKCRYCGEPLKWGDFAYNQDTCWNCYSKIGKQAIKSLDDCITDNHKIVEHAFKCVAEQYRKEFK